MLRLSSYDLGYLLRARAVGYAKYFRELVKGRPFRSQRYEPSRIAITKAIQTKKLDEALGTLLEKVKAYGDDLERNLKTFESFLRFSNSRASKIYLGFIEKNDKNFEYTNGDLIVHFRPTAVDENKKIFYYFVYGERNKKSFKKYRDQFLVSKFVMEQAGSTYDLIFVFLNTTKTENKYYSKKLTAHDENSIKQSIEVIKRDIKIFEEIDQKYSQSISSSVSSSGS